MRADDTGANPAPPLAAAHAPSMPARVADETGGGLATADHA